MIDIADYSSPLDTSTAKTPKRGDPTWELVDLFPRQGDWTVEEYLGIDSSRAIEFDSGFLEFLPMPTREHQDLRDWLAQQLRAVLGRRRAYGNPFPLMVSPTRFREPDVLGANDAAVFADNHATASDIAIEIVSPGPQNRRRDEVEKRIEYAKAGVNEYWIVDPENHSILVLSLNGDAYIELGNFTAGQTATSKVIEGFAVSVDECFAALDN